MLNDVTNKILIITENPKLREHNPRTAVRAK